MSGNPLTSCGPNQGIPCYSAGTVNGLDEHLEIQLARPESDADYFRNGTDFSPMPDPGGKGIYFVNGKSSGFLTAYHVHSKESTDIVSEDATQPIISPDGKRVMYITLPARQKHELWVVGHRRRQQSENRHRRSSETGTWAPDNFHLSFMSQEPAPGAKPTSSGQMVAVFGSSHHREVRPVISVWSPDQKSVYVSCPGTKGSTIPTRLEMERGRLESGEVRGRLLRGLRTPTPAGSTCLAS